MGGRFVHAVEKKRRGVDYLETKLNNGIGQEKGEEKRLKSPKLLNKAMPSHNGVTSRPGNGSETP
jgi:hypothetical protein